MKQENKLPQKAHPLIKPNMPTPKNKDQKKCRCGNPYIKLTPLQNKCFDCIIKKAKEKTAKKHRAEHREAKEKIKTRADYLRETQTVINKYVRLRDQGQPCISCDKPDNGQHQRHASHYRSVGACSALRFDLTNVHASCQQCNSHKAGNVIEYRIRLVKKLGIEKVEWLEAQNQITTYDIDYLKRLKKIFAKRCRKLQT
jgi:hypothetical protein